MKKIPSDLLFGRSEAHLAPLGPTKIPLHHEVITPFQKLQAAAHKEGFDLQIASGFRSYDRQLAIWNRKATGQQPLLDAQSQPLDLSRLTPSSIVHAILRWSALPGTSRHHWGTDFDVFDAKALPPGYTLQLIPAEVASEGMFGPLHDWLDGVLGSFGFFRPYSKDRGGVSPERWHLSYAPLALPFLQSYDLNRFDELLASSPDLALLDTVRAEKVALFTRYLHNVEPIFTA